MEFTNCLCFSSESEINIVKKIKKTPISGIKLKSTKTRYFKELDTNFGETIKEK